MLTKSQALYTFHPDVNYTCSTCVMLKDLPEGQHGCAWFGPSVKISAQAGSCGYYAHGGHPSRFQIPWLGLFTPEELGYTENAAGFGCRRCSEFIVGRDACKEVDRNSQGDTPGLISPYACCSAWEKDSKRGEMSDQQLVKLLAAPKVTIRRSA